MPARFPLALRKGFDTTLPPGKGTAFVTFLETPKLNNVIRQAVELSTKDYLKYGGCPSITKAACVSPNKTIFLTGMEVSYCGLPFHPHPGDDKFYPCCAPMVPF